MNMKRFILTGALLLAACEEKKDPTPAAQAAPKVAQAATAAATAAAPVASAAAAPASASAAPASPSGDSAVDGATILARMGSSVCKAFERCDAATLKSLGGLDKCAATMSKSPPPGFNKKKASCSEAQLSTCLKVYETASCESITGKGKKEKDPPECLACGIK